MKRQKGAILIFESAWMYTLWLNAEKKNAHGF